jgi:hypothetical protein
MTRLLLLVTLATGAIAAPGARAAEIVGYDGASPFNCELQQAGEGTDIPHPDADPLCVEYDKTNQSVLPDFGIFTFLAGEPARFAYAGDKCFYYQHDHWRGAFDQDDEQTETYNWDGGYFIDRARGVGGAAVRNFTVGNASGDPTAFPGFPEDYKPYFGYGRGGVQVTDSIEIDPACVEKAKREDVYRKPSAPAAEPPPAGGTSGARKAAPRLRLVHACHRVRVVGADRRHVRRVVVRAGGRTVGRDTKAPFSIRVRGRSGKRLHAVARLDNGRRVRLRASRHRACARRPGTVRRGA